MGGLVFGLVYRSATSLEQSPRSRLDNCIGRVSSIVYIDESGRFDFQVNFPCARSTGPPVHFYQRNRDLVPNFKRL